MAPLVNPFHYQLSSIFYRSAGLYNKKAPATYESVINYTTICEGLVRHTFRIIRTYHLTFECNKEINMENYSPAEAFTLVVLGQWSEEVYPKKAWHGMKEHLNVYKNNNNNQILSNNIPLHQLSLPRKRGGRNPHIPGITTFVLLANRYRAERSSLKHSEPHIVQAGNPPDLTTNHGHQLQNRGKTTGIFITEICNKHHFMYN